MKTMSYKELQKNGLIIRKVIKTNNYIVFEITKEKSKDKIDYDTFKKSNLTIQHDPKNKRVRLIGEKVMVANNQRAYVGIGQWVNYASDEPIYKPKEEMGFNILLTNEEYGGGYVLGYDKKREEYRLRYKNKEDINAFVRKIGPILMEVVEKRCEDMHKTV